MNFNGIEKYGMNAGKIIFQWSLSKLYVRVHGMSTIVNNVIKYTNALFRYDVGATLINYFFLSILYNKCLLL